LAAENADTVRTQESDPALSDASHEETSNRAMQIEASVDRLLDAYGHALAFAAELPSLGRCLVEDDDGPSYRLTSRFMTALYVQTHVRKQMGRISQGLDMELLSVSGPNDSSLSSLRLRVDDCLKRLTSWGRVKSLLTRLPPVSAAVPVLTASIAAAVSGEPVSKHQVLPAAVVLGVVGALTYAVLVWPSIRLGFRVKRALFTGGFDLQHPFLHDPGLVQWTGIPPTVHMYDEARLLRWPDEKVRYWGEGVRAEFMKARARRKEAREAGALRVEFPDQNIYELEDRVFELLPGRKASEQPIDLLLSPVLYVLSFVTVVLWVGAFHAAVLRDWEFNWSGLVLTGLLTVLLAKVIEQGIRNHRIRTRELRLMPWEELLVLVDQKSSESLPAVVMRLARRARLPEVLAPDLQEFLFKNPDKIRKGLVARVDELTKLMQPRQSSKHKPTKSD
jgi:hypothetical protein